MKQLKSLHNAGAIYSTMRFMLIVLFTMSTAQAVSDYIEFASPLTNNTANDVDSIVSGSFTKSGYDDIVYISNSSMYYKRSQGEGRAFDNATEFNGSHSYQKAWAVDVSGDGYDDLIAINDARSVYLFISDPDNTNTTPFSGYQTITLNEPTQSSLGQTFDLPIQIQDLSFGDFDDDGDMDMVIGGTSLEAVENSTLAYNTAITDVYGIYSVALNSGGDTIFPATLDPIKSGGHAKLTNVIATLAQTFLTRITAGDFNGDKKLDIAFGYHPADGVAGPDSNIRPGNGQGGFNGKIKTGISGGSQDVEGFISNGDGLGAIPSPGQQAKLAIALNDETHVLTYNTSWDVQEKVTFDNTPRGPMGATDNYNRDGFADLMFTNGSSSSMVVGHNWNSTSDTHSSAGLHLGTGLQSGSGGDFDSDGLQDVVGAHGKTIYIYFNNTASTIVLLYKKNNCDGNWIGKISADKDGTYNLTQDNAPAPNDQVRSLELVRVAQNTTVSVYDNPSGDTDDDWSKITVIDDTSGNTCVDTFEKNTTTTYYSQSYHPNEGFSISTNALDGKVSRIVLKAP